MGSTLFENVELSKLGADKYKVQMTKGIWLGALLGILLGAALAYTPYVAPASAPRTQLLMQQAGQPNVALPSPRPVNGPILFMVAFAIGLLVATPAFMVAKRRNK